MNKYRREIMPSLLVLALLILVLPMAVFLVGQREGAQNTASKAFEQGNLTPTPVVTPIVPQAILTDDAYVDAGAAERNFGAETYLWADGVSQKISYLKFDLRTLVGKKVTSAKLRLMVYHTSTGPVSVRAVSDSFWNEKTVTFANRPAEDQLLQSVKPTSEGSFLEVNLTSYVASRVGGFVSVAIDSENPNGTGFFSKEAISGHPELAVSWQ